VNLVLAPYPHRELHTIGPEGEIVRYLPASTLALGLKMHFQHETLRDLEVLYVGQAYAEGKRSAFERIQSHATLQKILADASYSSPDDEVYVLTFQYEPYALIAQMDGKSRESIRDHRDEARFVSIQENPLTQYQQICLIEAGLIRYFQPKYNETYKHTFPAATQKVLSSCFELDFIALTVEINTDFYGFSLYSPRARPAEHHLAQFDLADSEKRVSFFAIEKSEGGIWTDPDVIRPNH
jgi:hypothetical protein